MKRWLVIALGLGVAAAGLYGLVQSRVQRAASPPRGEIDDASHARLERMLREAEREEAR